MKKLFLFILSIIFTLGGCNRSSSSSDINIGVILPLTGSAAVWGNNALNGINLAMDEMEDELESKDYKINLVVEDSKSDPKIAVSALKKVIIQNNVPIVIGDIASSSVLAMTPIAERNEVVLLSPGASNPDISDAGEYIFRNWQSDALEGSIAAEFIHDTLDVNEVAVFNVNNAYGTGLANAFKAKFKELGGSILIQETFEQGDTDVRTQLNKINDANVNHVFMPGYPNEMGIALRQAKELGMDNQFISTQSFDDPTIIEIAGDAANGVIFSIPKPPDTTKTVVYNFIEGYKEKYGKAPGVCSNTGYDAIRIIIKGLNEGIRTGTEFKSYLNDLEDFSGAAGETTFDKNGDVVRDFAFRIINDGNQIKY